MFSDTSLRFLKALLEAAGPSGFEQRASKVWHDEAAGFAEVSRDVVGNTMATIRGRGGPTILLAGHIDEIGVIVTHVDEKGFVFIAPIGGWDPQVLVGQRIRFLGRHGDVVGVVGRKPIHLIKVQDREKGATMPDLWVDIGATSAAEATALLSVGDAGVIEQAMVEMPNGRIVSRAIDDRIGAFAVLEALRRYAASPGAATVIAVATTQEEIGYSGGGARVAAQSTDPAMGIAVDVTFATDHPSVEKEKLELGAHALGGGPVLSRGSVISPVVFGLLRDTAESLSMPYTVHAAGRYTSTDADAIQLARGGVATGLVSIPNRYMHSPNEMVALDDVDRTATLLAECCRRVDATTDFTAR
ncbi:MAG: M20/M25/M40 family metallo-hydrolase [Gemmatimonadaceae bacterium]|jgi:endoglucanase|nr:M20/M25/M40 family metallo-hydrolase [Gemmatimonadaceae bacterium]